MLRERLSLSAAAGASNQKLDCGRFGIFNDTTQVRLVIQCGHGGVLPDGATRSEQASKDQALRLADLADQARALGRIVQADRFLLLAWAAYEGCGLPREEAAAT